MYIVLFKCFKIYLHSILPINFIHLSYYFTTKEQIYDQII